MERFDNFKSIAMLFIGAFLVSLGIIGFLNLEIQSRLNHGVKVRNENLFEAFGRKLSEIITSLKEKNSYRRSLLYHLFVPGNTTRSSMRKLQYFTKDSSSNVKKTEPDFIPTHHRMRHEERIKKFTKLFLKNKTGSVLRAQDAGKAIRSGDGAFASVFSGNKSYFGSDGTSAEVVRNSLEVHENCYTTNDVLKIIAITCLVNFIFWFLIILCVNAFTKKQKMWKFNSIESLTSISSGSECDSHQPQPKAEEYFRVPNHSCLHKNYVNPYTNKKQADYQEDELRELFLLENNAEEKSNAEKCIHQRFIHLSNFFFDTVSLDNLKPVKKKSLVTRERTNKIVNSFSMEDLIC